MGCRGGMLGCASYTVRGLCPRCWFVGCARGGVGMLACGSYFFQRRFKQIRCARARILADSLRHYVVISRILNYADYVRLAPDR